MQTSRSCDLIHLNSVLLDYIKNRIYYNKPQTITKLKYKIERLSKTLNRNCVKMYVRQIEQGCGCERNLIEIKMIYFGLYFIQNRSFSLRFCILLTKMEILTTYY